MTNIVIGVDGGASKTRVIVADGTGAELASVTGVASAVRPGEAGHSADVIAKLVREALEACEMDTEMPSALCVGVAGVGRDAEYSAFEDALSKLSLADELVVLPDAVIALNDAFGDDAGIVLIAGTGSMAYGRGPSQKMARCGGWGPICGDEGSGAWIGRRALSVITGSADGREPETGLLGAILKHLELESPDELIPWAAHATSRDFALLATPVMTVAATGDLRANSLLTLATEELVVHVRTLARQLFTDERAAIPVALAGGMFGRGSWLRKLVEMRLKSAIPGMMLHADDVVPARGAVRTALGLLARA
ncbi:MAG TPA: BadF/BadG/BcrA/BcrD ATPase family protein [Gemmatimonadaceae bacterium]|nr:BadF/BadG/BcrA/BcrD ATPase family protein [Gemmatimonadaceae bacterium]